MHQPLFRLWIAAGSVAGLLGIAMAAFAAHAAIDPAARALLHSAVQMQVWHALALVTVGIWSRTGGGTLANWSAAAFLLGLLGFCGGVYAQALFDLHPYMIAPTGGSLLIVGWALLGLSALRAP